MSDNNVFDTLANDALETNDGEIITANQATYSFDEVDQLTGDKTDEEVAKEVVKTANDKQQTLEDKKELKPEENAGIEEEVEDEQRSSGEKPKESQETSEIKKLQAKFGDDSLEIPAEALIPHKVDGEEVEVPLQELLNNYSGKQAWDKRFSELDKERKSYNQEKEVVERYVNEFAELAKKDDKMAAMEYLAEFAGIDPIEFRRQLRSQVLEKYGNYQEMSEIERKALDQEEELGYHKRLKESEEQTRVQQEAVQELENKLLAIQETHGLTEDNLTEAFQELTEEGGSFEGRPNEVTPEILEKYVVNRNAYFSAKDTIADIDPELLEVDGFTEEIADIMLSNPELDNDDIQDIIREFKGEEKKRSKQQKASDKAREAASKSSPEISRTDKENYLTFDDLEI